jgi:hypothetical protein
VICTQNVNIQMKKNGEVDVTSGKLLLLFLGFSVYCLHVTRRVLHYLVIHFRVDKKVNTVVLFLHEKYFLCVYSLVKSP